jgi:hypothetical protein
MPIAFTEEAGFDGMIPQCDIPFIQDVVHEAFISVDKTGTEAAAATAVVIGIVSAPEGSVEMTVASFLFLNPRCRDGSSSFHGARARPSFLAAPVGTYQGAMRRPVSTLIHFHSALWPSSMWLHAVLGRHRMASTGKASREPPHDVAPEFK